jgi:hypothetical protein
VKQILIAACLALGLAGCNDFNKGDMVKADVGRVAGDPCLIAIQIEAGLTTKSKGFVARLDTTECRGR